MKFFTGSTNGVRVLHDFLKTLPEIRKNKKVVLASGTWDLLHVGHAQYLSKARRCGDVLVVGVDSDEKVKKRKGPDRPIVPEKERVALLSHLKPVDYIAVKHVNDGSMSLIKAVKPDVLIISETTGHDDAHIERMRKYCGKVVILPAQATTSTTAKVRKLFVNGATKFAKRLSRRFEGIIEEEIKDFKG